MIATGWTECVALRRKRQFAVVMALNGLRHRFPFPIRGIDSDNGSEFLNEAVFRFCTWRKWTFTRSRLESFEQFSHLVKLRYVHVPSSPVSQESCTFQAQVSRHPSL